MWSEFVIDIVFIGSSDLSCNSCNLKKSVHFSTNLAEKIYFLNKLSLRIRTYDNAKNQYDTIDMYFDVDIPQNDKGYDLYRGLNIFDVKLYCILGYFSQTSLNTR